MHLQETSFNPSIFLLEHGGYNGPETKITITQKINHDGEVNRYVPFVIDCDYTVFNLAM